MNLFDKISEDIKKAMLARDKVRLEALRGVKKEFLEAKTAKGSGGVLTDEAATKILVKKDGETVVNFPLPVGVVGVVAAAPWALLLAAVTTLGLDCGSQVIKENGDVIHLA